MFTRTDICKDSGHKESYIVQNYHSQYVQLLLCSWFIFLKIWMLSSLLNMQKVEAVISAVKNLLMFNFMLMQFLLGTLSVIIQCILHNSTFNFHIICRESFSPMHHQSCLYMPLQFKCSNVNNTSGIQNKPAK